MKYRAEIDGLRAVAIISVIMFHAGYKQFSGGFVGVDVFFVVSGYLITTIILAEKERGTFSLVNFYERRARRILPALFLIMLVSLPFAWVWLMPSDMKDFSQSLVAVSTFSSNILFWRETGYWGTDNELKPLLHTWSLAVEEQYYILFPLFLMLMWRFRKRWIMSSFLVIAAISLLGAQWGAYHLPLANFFLLPTRSWEIAIGACIAFYLLYRKQTTPTLLSHKCIDDALGVAGLLMIGYAILVFDERVPFPSFYALVPTTGAGLVILFSSPQTVVGRLLGTRLLVGIGLMSYSAYLWHQPLFAFAHHRSLSKPSDLLCSSLVVLSFLLAYLSWRCVEKPFRNKEVVSKRAIFSFALIGSIAFIAIGLIEHMADGLYSQSMKSKQRQLEEKIKPNYGLSDTCKESFTLSPDCRTSDDPEILIWGDSYAMHLVQLIMASNPDAKIIQMTKSVCGPFFDVAPVIFPSRTVSWARGCLEFSGKVHEWLKTNKTVRYAVISSPFKRYLRKETDNLLLLRSGDLVDANIDFVMREFERTLSELEAIGITPIVVSPPPQNGSDLGRCLARAEWMGLNADNCNFRVDEIPQDLREVYDFLEAVKAHYQVVRLDRLLCDSSQCKTHFGTTYLYRDSGHLSTEGSAALGVRNDFYRMIVNSHSYK